MNNREYKVYAIYHNNDPIYIGMTKNLRRRQNQHNRALKDTDNNKKLYTELRKLIELKETEVSDPYKIELVVIKNNLTKIEAIQWEAFFILDYNIRGKGTFNSLPKSVRYY